MSLAAIAWRAHPDFPVVVLFNRDELHARPAQLPAWHDMPCQWLGGQDEQGGGTWLGIMRDGRFALVTGFTDDTQPTADTPSRGQLVIDYLASEEEPVVHSRRFMRNKSAHLPFNLIVGNTRQAFYAATKSRLPLALTQGMHTLSNGLLDQRWPQNERIDTVFGAFIKQYGGFRLLLDAYPKLNDGLAAFATPVPLPEGELTVDNISAAGFAMLSDRTTTTVDLPQIGLDEAENIRRSACFVVGSEYGTRSSSVFVMSREGKVRYEERSFDAQGVQIGQLIEHWEIDPSAFSADV